MTDMTAEQRFTRKADEGVAELDKMVAQLGLLGGPLFWSIAFTRDDLIALRRALTAPRVPDGWIEFVREVVESAEGYESRSGNKVNSNWVERGRALLTAAPAPADQQDDTESTSTKALRAANSNQAAQLTTLRERVKVLECVLDGLLAIIGDSRGVAGYHLNGQIAEWDEFEEVERAARLREGGSNE